ncbi:MAG: cyclase family protein [Acidimicrobiales bacterium]
MDGDSDVGSGKYRYEPIFERDDTRVSRSPWGAADEIGRLNWMSSQSRAEVLDGVDGSRVFDLAVDYFQGMPAWTSAQDPKFDLWMTHTPDGSIVDDLTGVGSDVHRKYAYSGSAFSMYSHIGTHICSLSHVGHYGHFWNGWNAASNLGSRSWTVGGCYPAIITRAVLVDVAALHGEDCLDDSYEITIDDLCAAERRQGVQIRERDMIILRTGRMSRWPDASRVIPAPPGLGLPAAQYLCESKGVMCIGVDGSGEVQPAKQEDSYLPVHAYLFATAGTPLIENLWLEQLALEQVYEVGLVALPLRIKGSTGCPTGAIAMPLHE